ncbi:hypothetical protein Glove_144g117 [Diversispora epigaea]|uniref:Uncharacterized protein n=1 Tax=Diversispora epigaea TaxID=1348612 RepID=A0A397IU40_9GLOM|nr:hypothetical protein Glove_144g117 [Diversispora epigaea]
MSKRLNKLNNINNDDRINNENNKDIEEDIDTDNEINGENNFNNNILQDFDIISENIDFQLLYKYVVSCRCPCFPQESTRIRSCYYNYWGWIR